ncbi:glycerophosphodiester phosphodiesterase family protein [Paenibacillus xerothermodurans]|uniref:glycerophosphodiester phosphodiesterase family protein n=1 Tax=Paenibacillus xerothermodurans TaxID=1977292 RepID=UPI001FB399AF|nr:glycerophosphodiester phosphodiesterase family protein [Paenibacillus xerothermodurans]
MKKSVIVGLTCLSVLSSATPWAAIANPASQNTVTDNQQSTLRPIAKEVEVIAHRGASGYGPEHTVTAYKQAVKMNADYVELDLQMTKDGQLIVMHDESLARTTNAERLYPNRAPWMVKDFTLDEIRRLDAGSWFNEAHPDLARKEYSGQRVMTLAEVIQLVKQQENDNNGQRDNEQGEHSNEHRQRDNEHGQHDNEHGQQGQHRKENGPHDNEHKGQQQKVGLYIETKAPEVYAGMEEKLISILQQHNAFEGRSVMLQSFSEDSLHKLKTLAPNVPLIQLYEKSTLEGKDLHAEFKRIAEYAAGAGPDKELVTPTFMAAAHENKLLVHPWTVNAQDDMTALLSLGVDGEFTNNP